MRLSSGIHVPDYYRRDHPIEIIDPLRMPPLPDVGRMPPVIPLQCAIARVDNPQSAAPGATPITLTTATGSGDLIVVGVLQGRGGTGDWSVTDSGGQSYTQIWKSADNAIFFNYTIALYYKENSASGVTTVSCSLGTSMSATYSNFFVAHYTGVATSGSLDQSAIPSTTGQASPWASTAINTTNADDLLVGLTFYYDGNAFAGSGSWNFFQRTDSNGSKHGFGDQVVASTGSYQFTGTSGAGSTNFPGIASFKAAAAGGGGFGRPLAGSRNNPIGLV